MATVLLPIALGVLVSVFGYLKVGPPPSSICSIIKAINVSLPYLGSTFENKNDPCTFLWYLRELLCFFYPTKFIYIHTYIERNSKNKHSVKTLDINFVVHSMNASICWYEIKACKKHDNLHVWFINNFCTCKKHDSWQHVCGTFFFLEMYLPNWSLG